MATVETSNEGEIDVAALLRKVNMLEVSLEMKAGVHEIAQLRDLTKSQASSITKLEHRVTALEKALSGLEYQIANIKPTSNGLDEQSLARISRIEAALTDLQQ